MNETDFLFQIAKDGNRNVIHKESIRLAGSKCVAIRKGEEEMLIKMHDPNHLTFDGSRIVLEGHRKQVVNRVDYITKWMRVLIFVAGAAAGAGLVLNF
jgi:hypothetical protein